MTKAFQDLPGLIDSAGPCIFFAVRNLVAKDPGVAPVGILEYFNAATGADYTLGELMQAGERIINAERHFLTRAGFSREDDSLPKRLTQTPDPHWCVGGGFAKAIENPSSRTADESGQRQTGG